MTPATATASTTATGTLGTRQLGFQPADGVSLRPLARRLQRPAERLGEQQRGQHRQHRLLAHVLQRHVDEHDQQ